MNIYEFMAGHPCLTGFLACVLASMINSVLYLIRQPLRTINIRRNGWPPAHLDADGDYKAHLLVQAQAKAAETAAKQGQQA